LSSWWNPTKCYYVWLWFHVNLFCY